MTPRRVAFVLLAWATAVLAEEAGPLEVAVSPAQATVGDPLEVRISIELPAADLARASWPQWRERWGSLEILEVGPRETRPAGGRVQVSQLLKLVAFQTGRHALEPIEVRWGDGEEERRRSPEGLAVEIRSVLPEETSEVAPLPPAPPVPLPVPRAAWWAIGALLLANLAAGFLLWKLRLDAVGGEGRVGAKQRPLAELEAGLGGIPLTDPRSGHVALSRIWRVYLARTLDFPALESTTREIERTLRSLVLPADWTSASVRLLRDCDRVKFSTESVSADSLRARIEEARQLAAGLETRFEQEMSGEREVEAARG